MSRIVTFQRERLVDVREEVEPLLARHWEEIALDKETVPLDPDWDLYFLMENQGHVCAVTARCGGELVGYANYLFMHNLHYRSLQVAEGDIFWLSPEFRKGLTGIRMLRFAEQELKALGVNKVVNKIKLHFEDGRVGSVFEHMGYRAIERLYAKRI